MKKRDGCLVNANRKALSLGLFFLCMKRVQSFALYIVFLKNFFMSMNFVRIFVFVMAITSSWLHATEMLVFRGDLSPANTAAYTISRSGVYQLTSAKTASGVPNISITANNVTLDLGGNTLTGGTNGLEITGSNVTVKNGTMTDMTQNGVLIQGNGCRLENCDIVSSSTGITLQNCNQCVLENCRVCNVTQAGVSLVASFTNYIHGCSVSGVQSIGDAYGFVAVNGGTNIFDGCAVREVQTNSSTGSDKVVGIVLSNEVASTIFGTTIQAIESLTTVSAYGLWVNGGNNATVTNNSVTNIVTSNSRGQGVFINQASSYVASNVAYDCDSSFTGVPTEFIDSQANARGVDNIDTNLTTPDQVEVAGAIVTVIESQVDALVSSVAPIQTIVDNRYACSYTPILTATTITTPGAYCLANTISNGDLSVTATGVTLCLNGRTIYNGTLSISGDRVHAYDGLIRGKTAGSGVLLTGDKCSLNDLRVSNCLTGFELVGADQNTLKNCQALNCTREGYLLTNATYNTLSGCQATSIVGTGTVAGIKTTGGIGNEIVDCTVNRVNSSATGDAYGLWGVTESRSQLHDNEINDVSAVAGVAKGLALDENMWLQNALSYQASFSTAQGSTFNTVEWLQIDPKTAYLLCSGLKVRIFKLVNGTDFNLVLEQTVAASSYSAQWLQAFGKYYVLLTSGVNVVAYQFDPIAECLLPLPNATYTAGTTTYDIDATEYEGMVYIAVGGEAASGAEVQILTFDGNYFGLVAQQEEGTGVGRLEWLTTGTRMFLGLKRSSSPQVKAYEFLPKSSPTLVARGTYTGPTCDGLRWLRYGDASYLACSFVSTVTSCRVLSFNPDAGTPLTLVAQIAGRNAAGDPDWLVTGSTIYLAVPEDQASVTDYVRILQFNPQANSLTVFRDIALPTSARAYSSAWYTGVQGRAYLAAGLLVEGANKNPLFLYGLDLIGSTTSVIQNNAVSNISGTGIAVNELSNPTLSNNVYSATTPYAPWAPYRFDPSNETILG
jgi:parallel beta-helix repeat protein